MPLINLYLFVSLSLSLTHTHTHSHIMSARELGDCDHRSQEEMIEIKTLLKVLVESQAKLAESQSQILNSQLSTQNQILEILKSIDNAGNNNTKDKDGHNFQNPSSSHCNKQQALTSSPATLLTPEGDTCSRNSTDEVAGNVKRATTVVYKETTQALSDDNHNEKYQQQPFDRQLSEFTGNHTTMEQNLRSKGDERMSKKYVLDGYEQLYYAAYDGDWEKANKFLENNPKAIREVITEELETALHIAVHRNHLVFIEEIVRFMPPEVLEYKARCYESTALQFAVMYGNLKAAELMVKKNRILTQICNCDGRVPLALALMHTTDAQKEIVEYLYSVTRDEYPSPFSGHGGASLLCDAINEEFYGLVSTRSKWSKQYGFEILVEKPFTFLSGARLTWWQRCIYSLIQVDMDAAHIHDNIVEEKNSWRIDERNKREKDNCSDSSESSETDEENPSQSIIETNNEDAGNPSKTSKEIKGNEKCHLESSEGVEWILRFKNRCRTNGEGNTAQLIFTEEHKGLVEKGEKWMKDTSGSCMLVAALVATVAFAAAFTVPGGNINDSNDSKNGSPVFLGRTSFMVFAVADALALFSSISSVLMFLAIYTSRYAEEDFLKSLPQKLIIGLGTLFISMATILVAFSASLFIILGDIFAWALIPITLLGCVPVVLFAFLQLPLFVEYVRSAYWGNLFWKHRYIEPTADLYNDIRKDN
ncbi:ankyrin repeat-containing protein NPR4-like isoform X2 [Papaver somniferum]|uniref:ankyrin repeat-containing protein NPR4-like isoform X2 n=1 Tax=Papaver somniferum TaxID=3469 RepID=UPI000E6FF352|nr:ankyrin repeat-containing protein NPR4-like isoform X2 [Papaver somniferum]